MRFLIFLLSVNFLIASEKIHRIKVCGERCSGTNFAYHLLHENFPSLEKTGLDEFGQKHFLPWFRASISGADDCLFVVLVRDRYDWLRSFYLNPHHVDESLLHKGFSSFLRKPWKLRESTKYSLIDNQNPWTQRPFSNVIELRKYKLMNYLKLGTLISNYLLARLEDISEDQEGFIDCIAKNFQLKRAKNFVPIITYKGYRKPYRKKDLFPS